MEQQKDEILTKVITVESIEDTGKAFKVKGGGKTFVIWKTKQDGDNTIAHQNFANQQVATNSQIKVSYVINNWTKDGKEFHSNKVIGIKPPSDGEIDQAGVAPFHTNEMKNKEYDKSELITRVALAKSYIESGRTYHEALNDLKNWESYIYKKNTVAQVKVESDSVDFAGANEEAQIAVEDIPF